MDSSILNDKEIIQLAESGMIFPFQPTLVTRFGSFKVISYGVSSFGYDIRLSRNEFKIFKHLPGKIVDPKNFDPLHLENSPLHTDESGEEYFILPGNSYGLGVAVEKLCLPDDVITICIGKSTYARTGVICNTTPAEPGWKGHLTLEFSNAAASDVKIYANEGVAQLLFFKGNPCQTSYKERQGKYQDQPEMIVLPKTKD